MKARITIDPPDDALLGELAPFLHSVLDAPRFETTAYVKQMYGAAPQTPICVQARIDGEIVAHQAFLWLPMRTALNNTLPATLSVNSSAAARLRGTGVYADLSLKMLTWGFAAGSLAYYGVTNEASMRATTRLGGKVVAQLPVRALLSAGRPDPAWTHRAVTPELLGGGLPERLAADADVASRFGVRYGWNAELLRWRLGFPGTALTISEHPRFWVVSTVRKAAGIPVVALLKVWARERSDRPIRLGPSAVASLARAHRTPAVIHVGLNADVSMVGTPLPKRIRPAPLFLTYVANPEIVATEEINFDTFELLDFDAL